jgi:TonB family protein
MANDSAPRLTGLRGVPRIARGEGPLLIVALMLAAAPPDLEVLLARPLSPGVVALLAEHHADPRGPARIREGLGHEQAPVRAASARVSRVLANATWVPTLTAALRAEADAAVAGELITALLKADPEQLEPALEAARRLGCGLADRVARGVGPVGGQAGRARFAALAEAGAGPEAQRAWLERARRVDPTLPRDVARTALGLRDAVAWSAALDALRATLALEPELRAAALLEPALREATLLDIARRAGRGEPPPAAVAEALTALGAAEADAVTRLWLALVDAAAGGPGESIAERLVAAGEHGAEVVLRFLDAPQAAFGLRPEVRRRLDDALAADPSRRTPTATRDEGDRRRLRLMAGYPPGFVVDTLAVAGCTLRDWRVIGGRLVLGDDGRPTVLDAFADEHSGPECQAAARALLLARVGDPEHDGALDETVLLPLQKGVLACLDQPGCAPPARPPRPVGAAKADLREPRKVRHEYPRYPTAAKANGIQGTVILRATIAPQGCISDLEVIRSPHPTLNYESLRAVAHWRYTPTLLDGVAVPVAMTITVNYRLN